LFSILQAYRSGERKNAIMSGVARDLSGAGAASAAGYFAGGGCS
jgi:cytochrome c553